MGAGSRHSSIPRSTSSAASPSPPSPCPLRGGGTARRPYLHRRELERGLEPPGLDRDRQRTDIHQPLLEQPRGHRIHRRRRRPALEPRHPRLQHHPLPPDPPVLPGEPTSPERVEPRQRGRDFRRPRLRHDTRAQLRIQPPGDRRRQPRVEPLPLEIRPDQLAVMLRTLRRAHQRLQCHQSPAYSRADGQKPRPPAAIHKPRRQVPRLDGHRPPALPVEDAQRAPRRNPARTAARGTRAPASPPPVSPRSPRPADARASQSRGSLLSGWETGPPTPASRSSATGSRRSAAACTRRSAHTSATAKIAASERPTPLPRPSRTSVARRRLVHHARRGPGRERDRVDPPQALGHRPVRPRQDAARRRTRGRRPSPAAGTARKRTIGRPGSRASSAPARPPPRAARRRPNARRPTHAKRSTDTTDASPRPTTAGATVTLPSSTSRIPARAATHLTSSAASPASEISRGAGAPPERPTPLTCHTRR